MTLPLLVANTTRYSGAWIPAARLRGERVRVVVQGSKDDDILRVVARDKEAFDHTFVLSEGVNELPITPKSIRALRVIREQSSGAEIFVDAE